MSHRKLLAASIAGLLMFALSAEASTGQPLRGTQAPVVQKLAAPGKIRRFIQRASAARQRYMSAAFTMGEHRVLKAGEAPVKLWAGSKAQWAVLGAWVASQAYALHSGFAGVASPTDLAVRGAAFLGGLLLADMHLALQHWGVDNYGSPKTPFVGPLIYEGTRHHNPRFTKAAGNASIPWTLGFAIVPTMALTLPLLAAFGDAAVPSAAIGGLGFGALGSIGHLYAHRPEKQQGPVERRVVKALRGMRLLASAEKHLSEHHGHGDAHSRSYAALNDWSSYLLDHPKLKLLRRAEKQIFQLTGAVPNAWREEHGGEAVMDDAIGAHPALRARAVERIEQDRAAGRVIPPDYEAMELAWRESHPRE